MKHARTDAEGCTLPRQQSHHPFHHFANGTDIVDAFVGDVDVEGSSVSMTISVTSIVAAEIGHRA